MAALALTFDDGPDPEGTPLILEALARAGARATFFVIAPRAAAQPELVARIGGDGHAIGLHCDEHVRHSDRDAAWCRADTEHALSTLDGLGVTPCLWRTPWGDCAPWTVDVAREHELRIVGWTVDTHDWRGDSAEAMFAATRSELTPGAIVLAHDGIGPGATRDDVRETADYVARVADHVRGRQLELTSLA
jgi:peptidoglycan/xylan/chitin deacetylase (PgdA/CDA1 family)